MTVKAKENDRKISVIRKKIIDWGWEVRGTMMV